ncbi:MAG: hypothetical protein J6V66_06235 [Clostridia bacterium]|nr:hypothetical protein [Clostridia bacterium]
MNNNLKVFSTVYASQCNDKQVLRTDAILNFFQDLATEHAIELKTDYHSLKSASNAFWVISKIKFKRVGQIRHHDAVTVSTWPIKPQSIRFMRDYNIKGENGEIHGTSEWCVLDFNTMSLRRLDTISYPADMEHIETRAEVSPFNRFREEVLPEHYSYTYTAEYSDIDVNGHVNNVVYAKMALNTFTPCEFDEKDYNAFEIHFLSQCFLGNEIKIFKKQLGNAVYVEGRIEEKAVFKSLFYKE